VPRLATAAVLLALVPVAHQVDALVTVAAVAGILWALLAFEAVRHAEVRHQVRHGDRPDHDFG
jgi:hypothetical protein